MKPYPVYYTEAKKNPYDDSVLIQDEHFELDDGRPIYAMLWAESGYTFLTYLFSHLDLEGFAKDEIVSYLKEQGIELKEENGASLLKAQDVKGNLFWNYTITIGDDE